MKNQQRAAELMVQGRDLPWLLNQWVKRTPNKPFIIWAPHNSDTAQHKTWTYADFYRDVSLAVAGLKQQGVKLGQRVLIHMDNCPEYLIAHFACAYLGAVAVLTNSRSTASELAYFIPLTEVVAAITQPQYINTLGQAILKANDSATNSTTANNTTTNKTETRKAKVKSAETGQPASAIQFVVVTQDNAGEPADAVTKAQWAASGNNPGQSTAQPAKKPPPLLTWQSLLDIEPDTHTRAPDPLLDLRVQFTSGTTSRPKAVLSTHANSLFAAWQTSNAYALRHNDICQLFVPLFHNNGMAVLVMGTLWVGGTLLLQRKFSASNFWQPALDYKATWTSVPGALFIHALQKHPVPKHHFRFWYIAVVPEIEKHFNVKTRGHWGMTEMIALPIVGDANHNGPLLNIGRPAPGTEIAIRNSDGSDCQPGYTGHLFVKGVRGITLFKEYLNNPKATDACFDKDGWFDTGDLIRIDQQGNLFFADRAKDMLRVAGENVSASEVEAVINQCEWVTECAVVGQKHAVLDEVPVAFVTVSHEGLKQHSAEQLKAQLIDFCQARLADFKVLRKVYILDEFPRSSLNKIAKQQLRKGLAVLQ